MNETEFLELRALLQSRPWAALATLHKGEPAISMVPFARRPRTAQFVIHVSRLATHTADLLADPSVALLVAASDDPERSPLALPRASLRGHARALDPASTEHAEAKAAYLAKLPDSLELFSFADFSLFAVEVVSIRFVAGFGRAHSIVGERLTELFAD